MVCSTKVDYKKNPQLGNICCSPGIDNSGKSELSLLWDIIPAVVTAYNTEEAIKFAMRQHEIAKEYLRISEWWRSYYNNYFRPVEDVELAESLVSTEETPFYDTMRGRAQTAGRIRFKNAAVKAAQCTSEYCTGLRQQIVFDTIDQEARTIDTLTGFGYRNERAYIESRSDVRWHRMLGTVQRGRDMQATAINSAQLAFGIYGELGQQAAKGAEGAISAYAYMHNRNDTYYPGLMRSTGAPSGSMGQAVNATSPSVNPSPMSGYVPHPSIPNVWIPATAAQMGQNNSQNGI